MSYQEIIKRVQENSGLSESEAEQAFTVFVETLAVRMDQGEREDFASQLPEELEGMIMTPNHVESTTANDFYEEIGATQDIDPAEAQQLAQAVWNAIKEAVTPGQLDHLKSQIPAELAQDLN